MEIERFPHLSGSTLKQLHYFLIVAQSGSFRSAGEQLSRSTSAISMQIRTLEASLGFPLFARTTRRVELTREGRRIADAALVALSGIETVLHDIRQEKGLGDQRVTVGFLPSLAAIYVPQLLTEVRRRLPDLSVEIYEASSDRLISMVAEGRVNLGVGQIVPDQNQLRFKRLMNEPLLALFKRDIGPDHASAESISLTELCQMPLLLFDRPTAMRQLVNRALESAGLTYTTKYQCRNVHTLVAMAEGGLGAAVLPSSVISAFPSSGTVSLPISDPALVRTIALIHRDNDLLSNAARTVARCIKALIHPHP